MCKMIWIHGYSAQISHQHPVPDHQELEIFIIYIFASKLRMYIIHAPTDTPP